MVEKTYKAMKTIGAGNIVLGIIMIVSGVSCGVLTIVSGVRLLKSKQKLTF